MIAIQAHSSAPKSQPTHAVSYLRVSGKGQVDGDRFDRQRDAIALFAKRAKYEVIEEFTDAGRLPSARSS